MSTSLDISAYIKWLVAQTSDNWYDKQLVITVVLGIIYKL